MLRSCHKRDFRSILYRFGSLDPSPTPLSNHNPRSSSQRFSGAVAVRGTSRTLVSWTTPIRHMFLGPRTARIENILRAVRRAGELGLSVFEHLDGRPAGGLIDRMVIGLGHTIEEAVTRSQSERIDPRVGNKERRWACYLAKKFDAMFEKMGGPHGCVSRYSPSEKRTGPTGRPGASCPPVQQRPKPRHSTMQ